MKLFRNPGMIIAVFWCAAMIIAPMAAAAGACPGMNPRAGQGNNQLQQGPAAGPGNTLNPQGDGQNTITPVQGSRPQGPGKRNMTESANRTPVRSG